MIRSTLLAVTIAALLFPLQAAVSVGVDCSLDNSTSTTNDYWDSDVDEFRRSSNSFSIRPTVGIYPSGPKIEIAPFLLYSHSANRTTETDSLGNETKTKSVTNAFGGGIGAYFHVVDNDRFSLSFGPQFGYTQILRPRTDNPDPYDSYYNSNIGVYAPINFDFKFSDRVTLRVSSTIAQVAWNINTYKTTGSSEKFKDNTINYGFASEWYYPTLGLRFNF